MAGLTESLGLPPWQPPTPREVPERRSRLRRYMTSRENLEALTAAVNAGRTGVLPVVEAMDPHLSGAAAASLLAQAEANRLGAAALYYATGDMTSLALAVASTPPTEVVRRSRLPADAGFMVFAEPIGGYTDVLDHAPAGPTGPIEMPTPIVAVSWSTWTPGDLTVDGAPVRWANQHDYGEFWWVPQEMRGVWLTFYAAPGAAYSALPADTVVATDQWGSATITAGQVATEPRIGPLTWDNESVLGFDWPFGDPQPDTTTEWAQVVYTAWQLMSQVGQPLTEIEELHRDRHGHKRDTRAGITGPSDVRIVHVHAAHRPSKQAADQDAAASTGRRAPQWSCRWPVRPYRRNTCLNPHAHAAGDCEHEDRIVPAHIKGPA
ncbi:MAG: hypothetical protein ACRDQW_07925, partial [Haloechinothrix sp.]